MSIHLKSDFVILDVAKNKYNKLSVEIQFRDLQIAEINKSRGIEDMEIEIFSKYVEPNCLTEVKIPLADFLEALNTAIELLKNA